VATWQSIVRSRTELGTAATERLRLLIGEWSLLADLGFADFVLFVRTWDGAGWIAIAHVRPTTAPTMLDEDPVGLFVPRSRATPLEQALQSGAPVTCSPPARLDRAAEAGAVATIPVPFGNSRIAVLARYSGIEQQQVGEMERNYLAACDALLEMVAAGSFPQSNSDSVSAAAPRVGDGIVRLDADGRVGFASPNARTCLRRLGVSEQLQGASLADLLGRLGRNHGPMARAVRRISRGEEVGAAELATGGATASLRSVPLRGAGSGGGAVVLLRDITELRRQEQALLSKDATIREIHHRVKNNLQTVGALLRLQARRLPPGSARTALSDAMTRVTTIALVHESLAHSPGEQVDFDEISRQILTMARDAAAANNRPIPRIDLSGSAGILPSELATPLAMVLSELLLNAMEHSGADRIWLDYRRMDTSVGLAVLDDGVGFDPGQVQGLGLDIVRTLVVDQLQGELEITSAGKAPWPRPLTSELETDGRAATTKVRVVCALES
jgi:two-component sensor histidine kinase/PAS domain-containing protein